MKQIAKALGRAPQYTMSIADTIRDFNNSPHRIIKMVIVADKKLPVRNAPFFVRIKNGRKIEESWLIELDPDEHQLIAFFPVDLSLEGQVEFKIGDEVLATFRNPRWDKLQLLESELIDNDVVVVDKKWIRKNLEAKK